MELEQLLIEKSEVHEALEKAEHMAMNLETEKKKLQDEIKLVRLLNTRTKSRV